MSQNSLQEVFADCIERMASGSRLEDCLALYPEFAEELRPLLETAQESSRIGIQQSELTAMRQRLDSQIEGLIQDTNFKQRPILRFPSGTLVLVASLVVVVIGIMVLLPNQEGASGSDLTATADVLVTETPTLETLTPEITGEPTATETPNSETITPEVTPEPIDTTATEDVCVPNSKWVNYQVRAGDSLSSIALNADTTVEALQLGNCLGDRTIIVEGQRLLVPRLWEIRSDQADSDSDANEQGSQNLDLDDDDHDDDDDDDDFDDED